jgi:hypothetical protein
MLPGIGKVIKAKNKNHPVLNNWAIYDILDLPEVRVSISVEWGAKSIAIRS